MSVDITKQYTMWCSFCCDWNQATANTMRGFVKGMRRCGWKKQAGRWRCPRCVGLAREPSRIQEAAAKGTQRREADEIERRWNDSLRVTPEELRQTLRDSKALLEECEECRELSPEEANESLKGFKDE